MVGAPSNATTGKGSSEKEENKHRTNRAKERFQLAFKTNQFPPVVVRPETRLESTAAQLHGTPYFVWCPEVVLPGRRPACQRRACPCSPSLSKYKFRQVHDINHVTEIIYAAYECSVMKKESRSKQDHENDEDDLNAADKTGRYFSTLSESFLESIAASHPRIIKSLPYIFTLKSGFSKDFAAQIIDASIRSPAGLAQGIKEVESFRASRYYDLLEIFAAMCKDARSANPSALLPQAISIEHYLLKHAVPDPKTLTEFWLEYTKDYEWAANLLMETAEVKHKISVDATCTFAKRMRIYLKRTTTDANGHPVTLRECRMVLVLLNEIGQVLHICFVKSENHEEIGAAFKSVYDINICNSSQPAVLADLNFDEDEYEFDGIADEIDSETSLSEQGFASTSQNDVSPQHPVILDDGMQGPPEVQIPSDLREALMADVVDFPELDPTQIGIICCDNANSYRAILKDIFGDRWRVTQDPKHLMQRLNMKIKAEHRDQFSSELTKKLYSEPRHLWERSIMFYGLRKFILETPQDWISCTQSEWDNTFLNCLRHIWLGDLSPIDGNTFEENGITRSKIETSISESFNSLLNFILPRRSVSIRVGLRLMLIHVVYVNLSAGERFARIPKLNRVPLHDLMRAAVTTNQLVVDSEQTTFALTLMSKRPPSKFMRYRPEGMSNKDVWQFKFTGVLPIASRPSQLAIESASISDSQRNGYERLFANAMTHVATSVTFDKDVILKQLQIEYDSVESQISWNAHEITLLQRVREEQLSAHATWSDSPFVTTILYNHVVSNNLNSSLQIFPRSFSAVNRKQTVRVSSLVLPDMPKLFNFRPPKPAKAVNLTPEEEYLVTKFFEILSEVSIPNRVKEYIVLYNFAACSCDNIFSRSETHLRTLWNNKLQQRSRRTQKSMGIASDSNATTLSMPQTPLCTNTSEEVFGAPDELDNYFTSLLTSESHHPYHLPPLPASTAAVRVPNPLLNHTLTMEPSIPLPSPSPVNSSTTPMASITSSISSAHWSLISAFVDEQFPTGLKDWKAVRDYAVTLNPAYSRINKEALRVKYSRNAKKSIVPQDATLSPIIRPPLIPPDIVSSQLSQPPQQEQEDSSNVTVPTAAPPVDSNAAEPSSVDKRKGSTLLSTAKRTKQSSCDYCVSKKKACDGSQSGCMNKKRDNLQSSILLSMIFDYFEITAKDPTEPPPLRGGGLSELLSELSDMAPAGGRRHIHQPEQSSVRTGFVGGGRLEQDGAPPDILERGGLDPRYGNRELINDQPGITGRVRWMWTEDSDRLRMRTGRLATGICCNVGLDLLDGLWEGGDFHWRIRDEGIGTVTSDMDNLTCLATAEPVSRSQWGPNTKCECSETIGPSIAGLIPPAFGPSR
ncbi:hypothetical protein BCR33DRAFT_851226 [Rhizoclosmatium globosum]|uniref:Uncharacterized protein n=1 Tax=Rhizoclosmatium globosum TaxID=329046 RepID=A0A1Y2C9C9_9FUNG|nr:hypothetical protein BCR33DRAFT_851226 [Rhizoclosmatium globosum]|eukprot:ORY43517.1 hypothetical protein BCR33DRAFT_851226 [Rhizoclosmatium globosum]